MKKFIEIKFFLLALLIVFTSSLVAEANPITFNTTASTNITFPTSGTLLTTDSTATLTNKTFNANGTGNVLSNVDIADLANGTAGQLITWSSGGSPTTVATGSSGQVLTSNGASNAPTFQDAETGGGTMSTLFVAPVLPIIIDTAQNQINSNTTLNLGQFVVPHTIVVNKISFRAGSTITSAGTFDLTVYSEDGQTQMFSVTTATIDTPDVIYSTSVSSVTLTPGVYWLAINPNGSTDVHIHSYENSNVPSFGLTNGLNGDVSSEPAVIGTLTISAGTPPATFTPTNVVEGTRKLTPARLDN